MKLREWSSVLGISVLFFVIFSSLHAQTLYKEYVEREYPEDVYL